jgi:hypothetical protein
MTLMLAGLSLWLGLAQTPVTGLRISGPVTVTGGGVGEYRLLDHAGLVLYRARQGSANTRLHSTLLVDGYPNAALSLDTSAILRDYELTRDEKRVLFLQDPALYVVPVGGGVPTRLSSPDESVTRFAPPLPDGVYAVYASFQTSSSVNRVRLVRLDGARPPLTLATMTSVRELKVTPDGSRVLVYAAGPAEVYALPTSGGALVPLTHGLMVDRGGSPWPMSEVSPDGSHVVFLSDPVAFGRFELFTVPVDGRSPPQRLHRPRLASESVGRYFDGAPYLDDPPFSFGADGKSVLFFASYLRRGSVVGSRHLQLLVAPVDANGSARVLTDFPWPPFLFTDDPNWMNALRVAPTGGWLAYQTTTTTFGDDLSRLFGVRADSGPRVALSTTSNVPVRVGDGNAFRISGDGAQVVFVARTGSQDGLHSVPIDGSASPSEISEPMGGNSDVKDLGLQDGWALYLADPTNEVQELFRVPIPGGLVERVSGALVAGGDVESFATGAGRVVYLADQDVNGRLELYLSTLPSGK